MHMVEKQKPSYHDYSHNKVCDRPVPTHDGEYNNVVISCLLVESSVRFGSQVKRERLSPFLILVEYCVSVLWTDRHIAEV